jgi:hypothetical protein
MPTGLVNPRQNILGKIVWRVILPAFVLWSFLTVNDSQLLSLKNWFDQYVKAFYGIDAIIDANVELKDQHTSNTCNEMRYITIALNLPHNQRLLAETVALFHDLGRFEQFRDFRTFVDSVSLNHASHSAGLVEKFGLLADLLPEEQQVITSAIRLHNVKALPARLSPEVLLYTRLIRDADKMDIYRVFHHYYDQLRNDPESFKANLDLPVTTDFTPSILNALIDRRPIDYSMLKTSTDVTLLHLAWVYDINFVASLRRIKDRGHLAELVSHLPDDNPLVKAAVKAVFDYIDERVAFGTVLAADH